MRRPRLLSVLATALVLASPFAVSAEEEADETDASHEEADAQLPGYTLEQCLKLADANHPHIWAARARLAKMRAQLAEAHTAPFSQFNAQGGVGLAPTVRGNNVYSPNTEVSLSSNLGLAWRVGVEGVLPLWTFGKISNLWEAAEAQIEVGEHELRKHKNQVRMDVRKAYFGLQLARDSLALLKEATDRLDSAIEKLREQVEEGEADEVEELKLRTFRFELEGRRAEALRYETIARASLEFLTGVRQGFDIPDVPLEPSTRQLGPVTRYLEAARLHRPEINMARAGLVARQAQVELQKAKFYPDLGIGLSASWARAPEVADQLNPFVRDDANYLRYGAALVFRWSLDFLPNRARVEQAKAELEELRQTERYALGGVGVEVETAYAQVADAIMRERAYDDAQRTARRWLIAVHLGIDFGTREESELVEPARQWATHRFNYLTAVMDLNVAWSNLALVTGWDELAPQGQ